MSFADKIREQAIQDAVTASKADAELWNQLREIARLNDTRRRYNLTEVIHLQAPEPDGDASKGSFLLRIVGSSATWTTVHEGKTDNLFFYTQDVALLHLIARRAGDQSHGITAGYAARVLGIEDTAPDEVR